MQIQEPNVVLEPEAATDPAADLEPAPSAAAGHHHAFLHTRFFSSLNGIRCLCCLAVIKEHVFWSWGGPRLGELGFLGVDLFFAISGFLIVTLLIRERERRGTISLKKFYMRRTLRIFPIYYLLIATVFLAYLAVSPWAPNGLKYYGWAIPVLLIYLQDVIRVPLGSFFHCWSLAMEEQFYLFWPTVEKYSSRLGWALILGGMLLINQGINFGVFDGLITQIYGADGTNMPIFGATFTPILLGVSLAYLLRNPRTYSFMYRFSGSLVGLRLSRNPDRHRRTGPPAIVRLAEIGDPAQSRPHPRLTCRARGPLCPALPLVSSDEPPGRDQLWHLSLSHLDHLDIDRRNRSPRICSCPSSDHVHPGRRRHDSRGGDQLPPDRRAAAPF